MFSHRFAREVALLVVLKLLLLSTIYLTFFSSSHRVTVGEPEVSSRLLTGAPPISPK